MVRMWRSSQSYGQDVEIISELWSGCGDHLRARAMVRMWKPSQSYGQDVETISELWSGCGNRDLRAMVCGGETIT
jgi:hypothetical protein